MRSPRVYCAIPNHRLCAQLPLLSREADTYFFAADQVVENCPLRFSEAEILARGCQLWQVPDTWERHDPHKALYLHPDCFWHLGPLEYFGPYLFSHQFRLLPFDQPQGLVIVAESDRITNQCEHWSRWLLQMITKLGVKAERSAEAISLGLNLAVTAKTKQGFRALSRQLPRAEDDLLAQANVD